MPRLLPLLALGAALLAGAAAPAAAQGTAQAMRGLPNLSGGRAARTPVVTWNARAVPERGGTYRIEVTGQIEDGWKVYAMRSRAGRPLVASVGDLPAGFRLVGAPTEVGDTRVGYDDALGIEYPYFADRVGVAARVTAGRNVRPGRYVVRGSVRYAACDDRICLPPRDVPFEATVTVGRGR